MKHIVKSLAAFYILFFVCIFSSCTPPFTGGPADDTVYLRFASVNFGGNWDWAVDRINLMKISLPDSIFAPGQVKFQRNELIKFEMDARGYWQPRLPGFNPDLYHVFKPTQPDPVIEYIYTSFYYYDNYFGHNDSVHNMDAVSDYIFDFDIDYKLLSGKISDIHLTYNLDSIPRAQFIVSNLDSSYGFHLNLPEDKYYNFDVPYTRVKESKDRWGSSLSHNESINFVVMADGYNDRNINSFRDYVLDAFENPANFHEIERRADHFHITNHFFEKYWDRINVFMFETVSPESGISSIAGRNDKMNIFEINSGKRSPGNIRRMEKIIISNYYKTQLLPSEVDVYIIFVNDKEIKSYTYAYGAEISYRNQQPVHPVIIRAPAGYNVYSSDFHENVRTTSIAHELGHAMARLQDEYNYRVLSSESLRPYDSKFRNISELVNGRLKWHRLIDLDSRYISSSTRLIPLENSDQKLGFFPNPEYYNSNNVLQTYYIPTINSTMRQHDGSMNYQFGPVNTYHMEGSFRTRLGEIPPQDPSGNNHEWYGYSFERFVYDGEWPPSKFE